MTPTVKDPLCLECKAYTSCHTYRMPMEIVGPDPKQVSKDHTSPLDILVVSDNPGDVDDEHGRPFMGRTGRFVRDWVERFKGLRIGLTHAVRCRTTEEKWGRTQGRPPTDKEVDFCRRFIEHEVESLKPGVVVILGGVALSSVWKGGPNSVGRAKVLPTKVGDVWFLTTYHPSMHTSKKRNLHADYKSLGLLIGRILAGEYNEENPDIRDVHSQSDLHQCISQLSASSSIYFDVETDTWDYGRQWPGMQTFYQPGRRLDCVGVGTSQKEPVWVLTPEQFKSILPLFLTKTLVAFNALYDIASLDWFYKIPQIWKCRVEDPFCKLISQDCGRTGNSLEEMAMMHTHTRSWKAPVHQWIKEENARRRKDKTKEFVPATIASMPWPMKRKYNGLDVYHLMGVDAQLDKQEIPPAYRNRYLHHLKSLGKVQMRGIPCDKERIRVVHKAYAKKTQFLIESLFKSPEVRDVVAEYDVTAFNVRSPNHCTSLLEKLEIDTGRTDSGKYARFDRATRQHLASRHSLVRRLHKIRTYLDLVSKFLYTLPYHVADDGRVHTTYTLGKSDGTFPVGADPKGGTTTARVSSRTPAMHNMKKDYMLRSCFVAPPGYVFVEMDHSAAEVRGLAHVFGVKRLRQWFNEGKDPYLMLMAIIDETTYEEVYEAYTNSATKAAVKARRVRTKTGFLAWQYGSTMENFAFVVGTDLYNGKRIYTLFDELFPEVRPHQQELINIAKKGQYIETLFGVRRVFAYGTNHDENQIKNFPMQSACSDITVGTVEDVDEFVGEDLFATVNVVHDALYGLVPTHRLDEAVEKVQALMENPPHLPFELTVKLEVEVKVGRNLGVMQPYVKGTTKIIHGREDNLVRLRNWNNIPIKTANTAA